MKRALSVYSRGHALPSLGRGHAFPASDRRRALLAPQRDYIAGLLPIYSAFHAPVCSVSGVFVTLDSRHLAIGFNAPWHPRYQIEPFQPCRSSPERFLRYARQSRWSCHRNHECLLRSTLNLPYTCLYHYQPQTLWARGLHELFCCL